MRSFSVAATLALVLFAASTAPVAHAAHGLLKERQHVNIKGDCLQDGPKNRQAVVKVVNPTTTRTFTLFAGRKPLAIATNTRSERSSRRSTSTRAASTKVSPTQATPTKVATSTKQATTTSKAPSTSVKPTTTSKPATTSKAASTSSSSSTKAAATTTAAAASGNLSAFAATILKAHNDARAPRGANALTWSTEAEAAAKAWGDKCIWTHGGNPGMGQNLATSAGYKQSGQAIVDGWVSEESEYNPSNPVYSHFTQVVWKSTTQVGCYQSTCEKLVDPEGKEVFPGYSPSYFTVCNYKPPGNYAGQYAANVQKLS